MSKQMLKIVFMAAAIFAFAAGSASDSAQAAGPMSPSAHSSCGKFVDARMRNPDLYNQLLSFTEGYLSAAEDFANIKPIPARDVEKHVFLHCYENRMQPLTQALADLIASRSKVASR
ncbi:MAG: hypothetical protein OQK07_05945 [Rhodospirillales bacterium]|nr:hypothetical protein [Rhodospirillales bacterium]